MKSESEFRTFYDTELYSYIEPLENYRKKEVGKVYNWLKIAAACTIFITLGILTIEPLIITVSTFPMFLFLGLAYNKYITIYRNLKKHFKYDVILRVIRFLYPDSEYIDNQKIAKQVLVKSKLFPAYIKNVFGEDFMKFHIDKSIIMFCETEVYKGTDQAMFRGIFVSCTFNKYFNSDTFVLAKKSSRYLGNILKRLSKQLQRIKLENNEFNKAFTVLGNDPVEARYILSPGLMQRILEYQRKIKKKISFSFTRNRMYCSIPNFINLFEAAVFIPIDYNYIKKSYTPIKLYTDIVHDLNINLRIWSKQ
ncbi:MAG: DUF3137 domain-containing protein [Bacteroidales bacterium]|nr:DUF3137 domain-containing protein [Bacteroidales bacterium]